MRCIGLGRWQHGGWTASALAMLLVQGMLNRLTAVDGQGSLKREEGCEAGERSRSSRCSVVQGLLRPSSFTTGLAAEIAVHVRAALSPAS